LLFAAQHKSFIAYVEETIIVLSPAGYRISAEVIAQLKLVHIAHPQKI